MFKVGGYNLKVVEYGGVSKVKGQVLDGVRD